jgi:RNA polymerase sigma-70 factor (ECF subfamily)
MEDAEEQELLQRYMDAFERYDIDELVQLLHDDAKFSMPPFALWLEGPAEVEKWMWGQGIGCKDAGLVATRMSGRPAVAIYKPGDDPDKLEAFNIVVLEMRDGAIAELHHFIDPRVFEANDLPLRIDRPQR